MRAILKFKNWRFFYYYLLFLCALASCNLNKSVPEALKDSKTEESDEDFKNDGDHKKHEESFEDADFNKNYDVDCGAILDEDSGENIDDFETVGDNFDDSGEIQGDDARYPDLEGDWVNLILFRGFAKAPTTDIKLDSWAIMVSKVVMKQNGGVLTASSEMCRLKVGTTENGIIDIYPIIPDSYGDSLDIVEKTFYLSEEGGEFLFHQDKLWETRACELEDPENDALPTSVLDVRTSDPDNTGINGLRMGSKGFVSGWAEIVQKVSSILDGKVMENGEIRGLVKWTEAQSVLWSDNIALSFGSAISQAGSDPEKSLFIFKRADSLRDCAAIKEKSAELFPEQAALYPKEFQ